MAARKVYGKGMIDMRTGNVWAFPTLVADPYTVSANAANTKGAKSEPIDLVQFPLDAAQSSNYSWLRMPVRPSLTSS